MWLENIPCMISKFLKCIGDLLSGLAFGFSWTMFHTQWREYWTMFHAQWREYWTMFHVQWREYWTVFHAQWREYWTMFHAQWRVCVLRWLAHSVGIPRPSWFTVQFESSVSFWSTAWLFYPLLKYPTINILAECLFLLPVLRVFTSCIWGLCC